MLAALMKYAARSPFDERAIEALSRKSFAELPSLASRAAHFPSSAKLVETVPHPLLIMSQ